jgi:hypothetical protein
MNFVIGQPCRCKEHASDVGFTYLTDENGMIKFKTKKEAQKLIDDFAKHEGLCESHKNRIAIIPETEVLEDH